MVFYYQKGTYHFSGPKWIFYSQQKKTNPKTPAVLSYEQQLHNKTFLIGCSQNSFHYKARMLGKERQSTFIWNLLPAGGICLHQLMNFWCIEVNSRIQSKRTLPFILIISHTDKLEILLNWNSICFLKQFDFWKLPFPCFLTY